MGEGASSVSHSDVSDGTVARQAPLSLGFSRQEYRSGLPCPPPGDLPDPGIELASPAWQVGSLLRSQIYYQQMGRGGYLSG